MVDERFGKGAVARNDMLGFFLQHGVDRDQVESEITVSLCVFHQFLHGNRLLTSDRFAGSDITATAFRATLLHIIINPTVYIRLQSEIDMAVNRGFVSATIRSYEAVRKLPYLQACIKEGLRVFPLIIALRERVTFFEGDTINGHHISGDVNIGLNMRGLMLDSVFGSDPDVFRLERWLESTPEHLRQMEKVQELVFGYGFIRCLGISIATMNLNKVLVEVIATHRIIAQFADLI